MLARLGQQLLAPLGEAVAHLRNRVWRDAVLGECGVRYLSESA